MLFTNNLIQTKKTIMSLKLNFLMILVASFMAYSCGDDTDELVGSWDLISLNITGCNDSSDNLTISFENGCTSIQGIELCTTARNIFSEDGSFRTTGGLTADGQQIEDLSDTGTWSRTGNSVVICDNTGDCNGSTIRINGNTVTVTSSNSNGCLSTATFEKN